MRSPNAAGEAACKETSPEDRGSPSPSGHPVGSPARELVRFTVRKPDGRRLTHYVRRGAENRES